MYTKAIFGIELKERVLQKQDVIEIGAWSYKIFLEYSGILDDNFLNILITLNTMELGEEFAFSYTMLNKLADDLIAGREIDFMLNEYRQIDS